MVIMKINIPAIQEPISRGDILFLGCSLFVLIMLVTGLCRALYKSE